MQPLDRRAFIVHGAGAAALALTPEWLPAAPRTREPLAIAVIGIGRQGRAILGELGKLESARSAAICDVSASRLKAAQRRASGVPAYADHRELLDKERGVQAVIVATPTHLHRQVVTDALAAGKHVYCEAPLAASLEDARAIARAARGAKTVFHTGMQGRSNPIYKLAHSFAKGGAIRDIATARAQHHKKTSWRNVASDSAEEAALNWHLDPAHSLGLVGELGTHQLDVAHWFLGGYPTSVTATGSLQLHKDGRQMPDTEICSFELPGGRRLQWDGTLTNSFEGVHESFLGEMGTIKLAWTAGWLFKEADAPTQGWEVYANRQQFHDEQGITLIADATKLAAQQKLKEGVGLPETPLHYALADFLRSVLESQPVVCSADEGLRAAAVVIRAREAVRAGGTVAIAEDDLKVS